VRSLIFPGGDNGADNIACLKSMKLFDASSNPITAIFFSAWEAKFIDLCHLPIPMSCCLDHQVAEYRTVPIPLKCWKLESTFSTDSPKSKWCLPYAEDWELTNMQDVYGQIEVGGIEFFGYDVPGE
jgi:hypothetical protein